MKTLSTAFVLAALVPSVPVRLPGIRVTAAPARPAPAAPSRALLPSPGRIPAVPIALGAQTLRSIFDGGRPAARIAPPVVVDAPVYQPELGINTVYGD